MNNQAYKNKARLITRLARERGELPSKPCEVCGSSKVEVKEIKDFLLGYKSPEEIAALPYCGMVVKFTESEEVCNT